jgi:protease I
MASPSKTVGILAESEYQTLEVWYPLLRLREAGHNVIVIGSGTSNTYRSKDGYPVTVDRPAGSVAANDLDALVIPGGWAPDKMRQHPAMVDLVRQVYAAGKPVAAICHAGWMLASAGICRGKKLTSFVAIKDDLIAAGANWADEECVVDGNLITSRKPDDLPAFMKTLLGQLTR